MRDEFQPAIGLSGGHLQSVLATAAARRLLGWRPPTRPLESARREILTTPEGVRLECWISEHPGARGVALLFHGWEGNAGSSYMLETGARLREAGFSVVRLNFRDHGDSHHLNEEPFHSCRIAEVVRATEQIAARYAPLPLVIGGFSLGGNFALRVALRAQVPIALTLAVSPVIDPAATLEAIETGLPVYEAYFLRRWRRSLRRKGALFPHRYPPEIAPRGLGIRELTARMVERYTDFGSLEAYFDGYAIRGDRLGDLPVPALLLAARDDPVIPVRDLLDLELPEHARLVLQPRGGHCGFIENWKLESWAARWVARQSALAVGRPGPEQEDDVNAE